MYAYSVPSFLYIFFKIIYIQSHINVQLDVLLSVMCDLNYKIVMYIHVS